jgi:hypothetical protein
MIKKRDQVRSARLPHSTCASFRLARPDGFRPGGLSILGPPPNPHTFITIAFMLPPLAVPLVIS